MRRLAAGMFITLDGVVEAPGRDSATLPDKCGWSMPFTDDAAVGFIMHGMATSDAMWLGRVAYKEFAAYWAPLGDEKQIASTMNKQRKYVVSTYAGQSRLEELDVAQRRRGYGRHTVETAAPLHQRT